MISDFVKNEPVVVRAIAFIGVMVAAILGFDLDGAALTGFLAGASAIATFLQRGKVTPVEPAEPETA